MHICILDLFSAILFRQKKKNNDHEIMKYEKYGNINLFGVLKRDESTDCYFQGKTNRKKLRKKNKFWLKNFRVQC